MRWILLNRFEACMIKEGNLEIYKEMTSTWMNLQAGEKFNLRNAVPTDRQLIY